MILTVFSLISSPCLNIISKPHDQASIPFPNTLCSVKGFRLNLFMHCCCRNTDNK